MYLTFLNLFPSHQPCAYYLQVDYNIQSTIKETVFPIFNFMKLLVKLSSSLKGYKKKKFKIILLAP